jgi:hypothetical protein
MGAHLYTPGKDILTSDSLGLLDSLCFRAVAGQLLHVDAVPQVADVLELGTAFGRSFDDLYDETDCWFKGRFGRMMTAYNNGKDPQWDLLSILLCHISLLFLRSTSFLALPGRHSANL